MKPLEFFVFGHLGFVAKEDSSERRVWLAGANPVTKHASDLLVMALKDEEKEAC